MAEYQKAIGKDPFIPPSGMLNGKTIFVPYIFTDDELEKFFHEADCNKSGTVFEQMKFCTYFRLTYTCGLRPQESRTLKRINVDLNSGEIRIVNSKWNRSRTVIMSDEMLTLARKYATKRDIKFPESEYFFQPIAAACTPPHIWLTGLKSSMRRPTQTYQKNYCLQLEFTI